MPASTEPSHDCPLCPRLHDFIAGWREREPAWFNGPVPAFLPRDAAARPSEDNVRLLIVGLAPGLRGANRTGRPFTGDFAGDLLYSTLISHGFARGKFEARPDDSLELVDTAIVNAVRCVPPENKPTPEESKTCRPFLAAELAGLERLEVVLALGALAHGEVLAALGHRKSHYRFGHGALHQLPGHQLPGGLLLADSYHCSRYNTNTGRLTVEMFEAVFAELRARLT